MQEDIQQAIENWAGRERRPGQGVRMWLKVQGFVDRLLNRTGVEAPPGLDDLHMVRIRPSDEGLHRLQE